MIWWQVAHQADKAGDGSDIAATGTELPIYLGNIKIFFLHPNKHIDTYASNCSNEK
jgi:hypothetical protein